MTINVQVVIDAASPRAVAEFWKVALGYRSDDPPPGFDNWDDALRAANIPEDRWDDANAIIDPEGIGPRIFFQKVPEGKTVKNRLHIDVGVARGITDPDEKWATVLAHVDRLVGIGGSVIQERRGEWGEHWMVMADPEGNEFCVQ